MVYCVADNILSPLGGTTEQNYEAVKAGRSALRRYENLWGIPDPFTASLFTEEQNRAMAVEGLSRFESLAFTSARKAIQASAIDVTGANVVFILSTTKANIELIFDSSNDDAALSPGIAARHISQRLGITTSPIVVCNACISGLSAIILALRLLESEVYDYAVVCGADIQNMFTVSGFQSLKAMSEHECRPFDIERLGLNLGEAAATLVLTRHHVENSWAIARGVVRNDAYHISAPSTKAEGAYLALSSVVNDTDADSIAFINAHGTATMFNDQMESVAIERAALTQVPVNAYKGYYGHTLGAAGVLETVLSMASADDHTILATRGFEEIGVSGKIQVTSHNSSTDKSGFVKMISGFGGCNAAIFVKKTPPKAQPSAQTAVACCERDARSFNIQHRVRITPSTSLIDGKPLPFEHTTNSPITDLYKHFINDYPKFYKMDPLARLGFVATELLLKVSAATCCNTAEGRPSAVILFNSSSSIYTDRQYLHTIASPEDYFPSPSLFVYTLPNIITGEIALRNHYNSETSFYITDKRDDQLISTIINASFADPQTNSVIGGWIDYYDESHFDADIYIIQLSQALLAGRISKQINK